MTTPGRPKSDKDSYREVDHGEFGVEGVLESPLLAQDELDRTGNVIRSVEGRRGSARRMGSGGGKSPEGRGGP